MLISTREASALPEAPLLTHISLIKRCGFASLTASYIWLLNRDRFIDIPAKLPRDLAEQAPAEARGRENKVIENEWEGHGEAEKVAPDLQSHTEMPGMIKPSLSDRPLW